MGVICLCVLWYLNADNKLGRKNFSKKRHGVFYHKKHHYLLIIFQSHDCSYDCPISFE